MKYTSYSDGRVEKSVTIKPITAIETTQQFLIFMLLIMVYIIYININIYIYTNIWIIFQDYNLHELSILLNYL